MEMNCIMISATKYQFIFVTIFLPDNKQRDPLILLPSFNLQVVTPSKSRQAIIKGGMSKIF